MLGDGGDGSALAAENARLRWDLSEARSQLEEARAKIAASAPPDQWVADHEMHSKAFESVAARNRVLETALSAAEAQMRRTESTAAAECHRLRKELSISEGRARGYQAVAAALEEQVKELKEQLADAALQRPQPLAGAGTDLPLYGRWNAQQYE
jgi:chromosome segregation ATPase